MSCRIETRPESTPAIRSAEDREKRRERPEKDPIGADREPGAGGATLASRAIAGAKERAGAGGVVMRAQEQAGRRIGPEPGETTFCEARRKKSRRTR